MGYLTTLTVYNDGVELIKNNAQDFADKLYKATSGRDTCDISVGNFCNLVRVQKPRHADDNTTYVHMGNGVFEMNPYSEKTKNLLKCNPEFFKKAVEYLENQLEELKKMTNL